MKMYGEDIVADDDYILNGPKNAENSYIYYYMKGKITCEDLDAVQARTDSNKASGLDTLDNYWVALDKNAGNAHRVTTSTTGNVYVKLYSYGLGRRIPVGSLQNWSIYLLSENTGRRYDLSNTETENFENNNILQFSDIPSGEYQLYISADNITSLPHNDYLNLGQYRTIGKITVSERGNFAGKSLSNPYNAYLLLVSRGTVSVYDKFVVYSPSNLPSL